MKGNIHILSLYDVILLIPNPPVLSRLTLHNFKSSILLYWYTTNAHGYEWKIRFYGLEPGTRVNVWLKAHERAHQTSLLFLPKPQQESVI